MKLKKKNKGFKRKIKEWEESVAGHIGKAADNMKLNDWFDLGIMVSLAALGWDHFKDPRGALFGPIAYKLATSMNVVSGTSGVIGLVALGVAVANPELKMPNFESWQDFVETEKERAREYPWGYARLR